MAVIRNGRVVSTVVAHAPRTGREESQVLAYNEVLGLLHSTPHGNLGEYVPVVLRAAKEHPEFLARLCVWNLAKGSVRDSMVGLPVIALSSPEFPEVFVESTFAALCALPPRDFLRGVKFASDREISYRRKTEKTFRGKASVEVTVHSFFGRRLASGRNRELRRLVERYLRNLESNWGRWTHAALQDKKSLASLYTHGRFRVACSEVISSILFGQVKRDGKTVRMALPQGSVFEALSQLKNMSPSAAAGTIMNRRIPMLTALGSLGAKARDKDILLAIMGQMSATELVTNTRLLTGYGVMKDPVLKSAYDAGMVKVGKSTKSVLKTNQAIEALEKASENVDATNSDVVENKKVITRLKAAQEKQLAGVKGIDGNWAVLGDKSGSMTAAIEISRLVSGVIAKQVRGNVCLAFFDTSGRVFDVSGKTYDEIKQTTKYVNAGGGTSIGAGLCAAINAMKELDGIVVVSDGAEHHGPRFVDHYKALLKATGRDIPVYFYRTPGEYVPAVDLEHHMKREKLAIEVFDLRGKTVDYTMLMNLVQSMSVNRYSVIQEIFDTELLTLDEVLPVAAGARA